MTDLHVFAIPGIPDVAAGVDLARTIADAIARAARTIQHGDVIVIAQKIVSKAEGAIVRLDDVVPSKRATDWAAEYGKDPRVVEVVLRESARIVRMDRGVLIAETRHGYVCANAGVDASNVAPGLITVLPRDPDGSAARLRDALGMAFNCRVATIVSDSFGRPWREGVVNVALGVAGLRPLLDYRGCLDAYGRRLESTVMAIADEIASAAELVMRKTTRTPVAVVRGAGEWVGEGTGKMLLRDPARDLFR
jgi:coenzyme F420-0:L-glutamate ligase / coenzyme F420-1:gamma-L-glutamate ligase